MREEIRSDKYLHHQPAVSITIQKITAVWGFTESAVGGVLHVLKIPLTGLFIGSFAVLCIFLIAHYSKKPVLILRSTIIVILIKSVVSPYSPLAAYFAVLLQGFLGYLFFTVIRYERLAAVFLGVAALLLSALQKVFVLTILFGTALWESIDLFYKYLINELSFMVNIFPQNISIYLISAYCGIHAAAGLIIGIKAFSVPAWITKKREHFSLDREKMKTAIDLFEKKKNFKKKKWWQKKSGILILGTLLTLMLISYFLPEFEKKASYNILIMIVRSFVITFFWFYLASPFIIKYFKKIIEKKKSVYSEEISSAISMFPEFKNILNYSWEISSGKKGLIRIKDFLSNSVSLLLFYELLNE